MSVDDKTKALIAQMVKQKTGVTAAKTRTEMSQTEKDLWEIFEERPVTLTEFIQGKEYLNLGEDFTLSDIQYGFVRHMEQILFSETYEKMQEVWGDYWKPERRVNNLVAAWGKGSAAPYERVYDARTGLWPRLDEIEDTYVSSASPGGRATSKKVSVDPFLEGHGNMYRVTTQHGHEMDVWEHHKFYTPYDSRNTFNPTWVPLSELHVGDSIAVSTKVPEPLETVEIPDWHVELIAFTVASINYGDHKVGYVSTRPEDTAVADRVREIYSNFTDAHVTEKDIMNKHRRMHLISCESSQLDDFVKTYNLSSITASEKRLPDIVFRLNTKQVALFVSRLFDVSGSFSAATKSYTSEIKLTSLSKEYIHDVQRLFLRLGAPSRIRERNFAANLSEPEWEIRVRGLYQCARLCKELTLLTRQSIADRILKDVKVTQNKYPFFGDLDWLKIKSIKPIGEGPYWSMTVDGFSNYVASNGFLNHNSGKNQTVVIAFARIAYILLCLRNPQSYYRLASNSFIHMMNVALSAPQAKRAFFKPMRELFITAPWFADKFAEDTPPGSQATTIRLKKRIELISGHSQADSQEGNNLIAAVADEIAGFPTEPTSGSDKAPMKTASGILKMLKTSALTRFPETYKLAQISFARRQGDAIMSAIKDAEEDIKENGDQSTYYKSGPYSTWEVNPNYRKNFDFISIPQSEQQVPNVPDIISDYRKDPAFARGYYECRPEASANAYFKDKAKVEESFSEERSVPPLTVSYYFGRDETDPNEKYASWQVHFTFSDDLQPVPGAIYAIHADMALKEDRAGIAMCHVERYKEIESSDVNGEERLEFRPVVKLDFVSAFEYDNSATDPDGNSVPREIQMRWYRKLVHELSRRGFEIGSVSQDGFGSLDSLQIMETWGYNAHRLSADIVTTQVWQTLRDLIYDGRMHGYKHKLLMSEILGVEKTRKGKIDHPATGSKDLLDAVACSATMAIECGGAEEVGENITDIGAFGVGSYSNEFSVFSAGSNNFFNDSIF